MPLNINWQQILLHMLNVAILFFVLYFVLYSPIKKFMAKREQYFKDEAKKGEDAQREANEVKALYEKKVSEAKKLADEEKSAALKSAEDEAKKRLEAADKQARDIIANAEEQAKKEHNKMIEDAKTEIAELATSMAEKIILKDTDTSYEKFLSYNEGEEKDE